MNKWLSRLGLARKPTPPPVVHEVVPTIGQFDKAAAQAYNLRRGMWVYVFYHGTGILQTLGKDAIATVMLVNEDGGNKTLMVSHASALRQATYDEIPEPRRPERQLARDLGY